MIDKKQKIAVWNKATKIHDKNPKKYRKDPYGNPMFCNSYGLPTAMGWEIDHITPVSKGGSDATRNLQALNTSVNRSKGADQRKRSRHSKSNK